VHEVGEKHLTPLEANTAAATTELAVSGPLQYLAVWRLLPATVAQDDPVWEIIRRAATPRPAYLYVPAFSLTRAVVQRLGVRLTEVQPDLTLTVGAPAARALRPALAEARPGIAALPPTQAAPESLGEPFSDAVSPIVAGRREAWGLAHFIYMAIEARQTHDLRPIDLQLQAGQEELLFLPAVWDPRCIHEANWRLLLEEFDGLVA
jgi:hypothetical protein